ncbi:hypothetical protein CF319_g2853 [Tilletia indica]|nr:hypothetical protein CF319_g2853 [Tilletia indica]
MASKSHPKSTTHSPKLGSLNIQVELYCPVHLPGTSTHPRTLPVFKTRVSSARDARRNIVDTLKRHIPALRRFDNLRVSFQPGSDKLAAKSSLAGKDAIESSKAVFESAVVAAISAGSTFTLKVQPLQNSGDTSATRSICFCPSAATPNAVPKVAAPAAASPTPAASSSNKAAYFTKASTSSRSNTSSKSSLTETESANAHSHDQLVKEKTELNLKLAENATKHASVVTRLAQLEAEHSALQEKYTEAAKAAKAAQIEAMAATAAAAKKTPQQSDESHLNPRFQSFCTDLLKNLNSSMSSNFGDHSGLFTFTPSVPATPTKDLGPKVCCKPPQTAHNFHNAAPAQSPRKSDAHKLVGPKVMPGPGKEFYCDICKRFCKGQDRYRCLRCPDWDACSDCCTYGLGEHGHVNYAYIPKHSSSYMSPVFGDQCKGCHVTPRDGVLYHRSHIEDARTNVMCATCFNKSDLYNRVKYIRIQPASWTPTFEGPSVLASSRLPHSRPSNGAELARVQEQDFKYDCDICHKHIPVYEWRYRCASCKDFDSCQACYDGCKVDLHQHSGFIEFAPGVAMKDIRHTSAVYTPPKSTVPQAHPAACDLCEDPIKGIRLKCLDCPDWDSCTKPGCVGLIPTQHPNHRFVRIENPAQIRKYSYEPTIQRHSNFFCDGCDERITGTRYACLACEDFDLCAQCEALPVTKKSKSTKATALSHQGQHGAHHLFVKIPAHIKVASRSSFTGPHRHYVADGSVLVTQVLSEARRSVAELCDGGAEKKKETAVKEKKNSSTPPPPPPKVPFMCGTALLAAHRLAEEREAKAAAAAAQANKEASSSTESPYPAAALWWERRPPAPTSVETRLNQNLAILKAAGLAKAHGSLVDSRAVSETAAKLLDETLERATKLPQSPVRGAASSSGDEQQEKGKGKACKVQYSMEAPLSQHLSYEEKRILSRRIEEGGAAAVDAFLSVLSPEELEKRSPDGDLVFEMDDLTADQYADVMAELDALEESAEASRSVAVKVEEEKKKSASTPEPAQMSELSSSFKTIRTSYTPSTSTPEAAFSKSSIGSVKSERKEDVVKQDNRLELDAEFVEDVSLPDGTVVAAGSRFDKVWLIRNSGKLPWPASVGLKYVAGDSMGLAATAGTVVSNMSASPSASMLPPGAECQVRLSALKAMEFAGRSTSYFRLTAVNKLGQSVAFGHQLWVDIDVKVGNEESPRLDDTVTATFAATAAGAEEPSLSASHTSEKANGSADNSTGRLGGSSVFTAPHAPESVRSEVTSSSNKGKKMLGGFRLNDDSDSEDEDDEQGQQNRSRNPFEDAILDVSDDEEEQDGDGGFDDDYELIDPTTEESDDE